MAESKSLRSAASEKRSRSSPTGCTPLQRGKRSTTELRKVGESHQSSSRHCQPRRRRLAFAKTDAPGAWSDGEQIALVEFILLHKPGRRWPADQDPRFWDSAAQYVSMRTKRDARSGTLLLSELLDQLICCVSCRYCLPHKSNEGLM